MSQYIKARILENNDLIDIDVSMPIGATDVTELEITAGPVTLGSISHTPATMNVYYQLEGQIKVASQVLSLKSTDGTDYVFTVVIDPRIMTAADGLPLHLQFEVFSIANLVTQKINVTDYLEVEVLPNQTIGSVISGDNVGLINDRLFNIETYIPDEGKDVNGKNADLDKFILKDYRKLTGTTNAVDNDLFAVYSMADEALYSLTGTELKVLINSNTYDKIFATILELETYDPAVTDSNLDGRWYVTETTSVWVYNRLTSDYQNTGAGVDVSIEDFNALVVRVDGAESDIDALEDKTNQILFFPDNGSGESVYQILSDRLEVNNLVAVQIDADAININGQDLEQALTDLENLDIDYENRITVLEVKTQDITHNDTSGETEVSAGLRVTGFNDMNIDGGELYIQGAAVKSRIDINETLSISNESRIGAAENAASVLESRVASNTTNINDNRSDIGVNESNITTNRDEIALKMYSTRVSELDMTIDDNVPTNKLVNEAIADFIDGIEMEQTGVFLEKATRLTAGSNITFSKGLDSIIINGEAGGVVSIIAEYGYTGTPWQINTIASDVPETLVIDSTDITVIDTATGPWPKLLEHGILTSTIEITGLRSQANDKELILEGVYNGNIVWTHSFTLDTNTEMSFNTSQTFVLDDALQTGHEFYITARSSQGIITGSNWNNTLSFVVAEQVDNTIMRTSTYDNTKIENGVRVAGTDQLVDGDKVDYESSGDLNIPISVAITEDAIKTLDKAIGNLPATGFVNVADKLTDLETRTSENESAIDYLDYNAVEISENSLAKLIDSSMRENQQAGTSSILYRDELGSHVIDTTSTSYTKQSQKSMNTSLTVTAIGEAFLPMVNFKGSAEFTDDGGTLVPGSIRVKSRDINDGRNTNQNIIVKINVLETLSDVNNVELLISEISPGDASRTIIAKYPLLDGEHEYYIDNYNVGSDNAEIYVSVFIDDNPSNEQVVIGEVGTLFALESVRNTVFATGEPYIFIPRELLDVDLTYNQVFDGIMDSASPTYDLSTVDKDMFNTALSGGQVVMHIPSNVTPSFIRILHDGVYKPVVFDSSDVSASVLSDKYVTIVESAGSIYVTSHHAQISENSKLLNSKPESQLVVHDSGLLGGKPEADLVVQDSGLLGGKLERDLSVDTALHLDGKSESALIVSAAATLIDGSGSVQYPPSATAGGNTIPVRDANGRLEASAGIAGNDVVNYGQVYTSTGQAVYNSQLLDGVSSALEFTADPTNPDGKGPETIARRDDRGTLAVEDGQYSTEAVNFRQMFGEVLLSTDIRPEVYAEYTLTNGNFADFDLIDIYAEMNNKPILVVRLFINKQYELSYIFEWSSIVGTILQSGSNTFNIFMNNYSDIDTTEPHTITLRGIKIPLGLKV